jgi:hypothetical protein
MPAFTRVFTFGMFALSRRMVCLLSLISVPFFIVLASLIGSLISSAEIQRDLKHAT